jgi:hypothetical protein
MEYLGWIIISSILLSITIILVIVYSATHSVEGGEDETPAIDEETEEVPTSGAVDDPNLIEDGPSFVGTRNTFGKEVAMSTSGKLIVIDAQWDGISAFSEELLTLVDYDSIQSVFSIDHSIDFADHFGPATTSVEISTIDSFNAEFLALINIDAAHSQIALSRDGFLSYRYVFISTTSVLSPHTHFGSYNQIITLEAANDILTLGPGTTNADPWVITQTLNVGAPVTFFQAENDIMVVTTATNIIIYKRDSHNGPWQQLQTLTLASAGLEAVSAASIDIDSFTVAVSDIKGGATVAKAVFFRRESVVDNFAVSDTFNIPTAIDNTFPGTNVRLLNASKAIVAGDSDGGGNRTVHDLTLSQGIVTSSSVFTVPVAGTGANPFASGLSITIDSEGGGFILGQPSLLDNAGTINYFHLS